MIYFPISDLHSIELPEVNLHSIELPEVKTVDLFSDSDLHSIELPEVNLHSIELPEVNLHSIELPEVNLHSIELPEVNLHSIELPEVNLHSIELPEVKISLVEERGCKENRIPHEISETPPAESFSETDEERRIWKIGNHKPREILESLPMESFSEPDINVEQLLEKNTEDKITLNEDSRCQAITKSGKNKGNRCKNKVKHGEKFCGKHKE